MKKILLMIAGVVLVTPFLVSADSGPAYTCFSPKLTSEEAQKAKSDGYGNYSDADNKVRGTCKEVKLQTVVSLDPSLQKDYLLGKHESISSNCSPGEGCQNDTKYSEAIYLTSSSTVAIMDSGSSKFVPMDFAVFDKAFFVPLLQKIYKDAGLTFLEKNIQETNLYVFKESEFNIVKKDGDNGFLSGNIRMDALNVQPRGSYPNLFNNSSIVYDIYSLNYQEYGKHIHGPKNNLIESQYVDVGGNNELSNDELQIRMEQSGRISSSPVVPLTSPLKSVTNYWLYTKKDGKLFLSWQKSEYSLDNGQVKVITGADKNISAALLFSNAFPVPETATPSISPTSSTASASPVLTIVVEQKKGFFARVLDVILSWFR